MGYPAARIGDTSTRGGVIQSGEPSVLIGDRPAARVADTGVHPQTGGPIVPPAGRSVLIGGRPAARSGDQMLTGGGPDPISSGMSTVLIGNKSPPSTKEQSPCRVQLKIISGDRAPGADSAVCSELAVSNFVTDHDLPDHRTRSHDPDNFRIEVNNARTPGADVQVEMLKPDRSQFSPRRRSTVPLARHRRKRLTYCLRLVSDAEDDAVQSNQTILAGVDPGDESVEILGQILKVTYRCSCGQTHTREATVGKLPTNRIKLAVHIVQSARAPSVAAVRRNLLTTCRQVYAQAHLTPRVCSINAVTPVANRISIADPQGRPAAHRRMIQFTVGSQNMFIITRPGDTPYETATLIVDALRRHQINATIVRNPIAASGRHGGRSCDVVLNRHLSFSNVSPGDRTHPVAVASVADQQNLPGFGDDSVLMGTVAYRALCHNHGVANHINLFVVNDIRTLAGTSPAGLALTRGSHLPSTRQAQGKIPGSVFVTGSTVRSTPRARQEPEESPVTPEPQSLLRPPRPPPRGVVAILTSRLAPAHEIGHALLDACHVAPNTPGERQQLMRDGVSGGNSVNASKRIAAPGNTTFGLLHSRTDVSFNQEDRLRSQSTSWLESA